MHKAIISKIKITKHPDPEVKRLAVGHVCNETVIVGIDTPDDTLGIYFPCELQLSEEFARINNLVRKKDPVTGKNIGGLFEENRRVRIQKIRNVKSCGFWTPLSSLAKLGGDISTLKEGDKIDTWNNFHICNKYLTPDTKKSGQKNKSKKKIDKYEYIFPEHVDTEQFRYNTRIFKPNDDIVVTLKLHGTSQRIAKNYETRPLKWYEKIINWLIPINNKSIQVLNGTRRVILNKNKKRINGYHPDQLREEASARLAPFLEDHMHIYFEVVGYEGFNKPIMPNQSMSKVIDKEAKAEYPPIIEYSYGCPNGTFEIYVYRISYVLPNGKEIDWLWDDIVNWCKLYNVKHVPELARINFDGDINKLIETIELLSEGKDPLNPKQPKEGVCVRINGNTWKCVKEKQFLFKVLEGIAKEDTNYVDKEEEQSA